MNTPWHLLIHMAQYVAPGWTEDNNFPVHGNNSAALPPIPCNVQESSSSESLAQERLTGTRFAVGYFPPEYNGAAVALVKDSTIVVTGDGFPSGGRTFKVSGIGRNDADKGVLISYDLEAEDPA